MLIFTHAWDWLNSLKLISSIELTEADLHFQNAVTLCYPSSVRRTSRQHGADMLKRSVQFPVDAPELPSFAYLTADIEPVTGFRLDDPHHSWSWRYRRRVVAPWTRRRTDNRTVTGCWSRPTSITSYIRHLNHRPWPPSSLSSSKFKTTLKLCPPVTLAPQTDSVVDNPPLTGVMRHGHTTWPCACVCASACVTSYYNSCSKKLHKNIFLVTETIVLQ